MTNLDSVLRIRDITSSTKAHTVKAMVFPGVIYGCGSWTIKKTECWRNYTFKLWGWTRLESPLDSKETVKPVIKPVNLKGNQPWIVTGRTDAEAEAPLLWTPDVKSWLTRKDQDAGKDWGKEDKGATEDEMVGWHQWHNGHEFEQTLGDSEGQGCSLCGHKESNTTEWLNNNNKPITRPSYCKSRSKIIIS